MDYLKRDSHSTGVPVAVDMSRVFQKLRVVQSDKDFKMKSTAEEDVDTRYTIAIAPVAINTVDQLIISRYMMFENVYYHQKTLTAETLLRYALEQLSESTKGLLDNFRNILMLQDNNIVHTVRNYTVRNLLFLLLHVRMKATLKCCEVVKDLKLSYVSERSM